MSMPTVEALLAPVLRGLGRNIEASAELAEALAGELGLSDADRLELVPGSAQTVYRNRLAWALVWFSKAGLIEKMETGRYRLTDEGAKLLAKNPTSLSTNDLKAYPGFKYYRTNGAPPATASLPSPASPMAPSPPQTPMEQVAAALEAHNAELAGRLLSDVRELLPTDFERLVVRVVGRVLMPTVASHRLHHVGKSGDGGIDGIIDEDALGLSKVYLQAKKYAVGNTVGVGEIHQFAGAMSARGATKGVFVTSSDFSSHARTAGDALSKSFTIRLVSGEDLVRMMIGNGIGVREAQRIVLYESDIAGLLSGG